MRVLVVTPSLPPTWGGLERLALDVHNGVGQHAAVETVAIARDDPSGPSGVRRVAPGRLAALRFALASIAALHRHRPDLVQAMTWKVAVPLLPFLGRRRLVLYAHGAELLRPKGLTEKLRDAVLRRVDLVVANSAFTAGMVRQLTPTPVEVVPPGVALPDQPSARRRKGDQLNVLSVGSLVPRKGHDRLIAAARLARDRGVPVRLTIAGDGRERMALEALAAAADGHVVLAGPVNNEELEALYRDADVFALLGFAVDDEVEGFGIVLLEAAAHGLPIVTTNTGGTADAITQDNAVVIESVDDAADAFALLFSDPERADAMAASSRAFAGSASVASRANELIALYQGIMRP